MEPKEAAQALALAYAALTQAIKDTKDEDTLRLLVLGLSSVASRLSSEEVAQTATALMRAMKDMKDNKDAIALWQLARGQSAVAPYLGPKEAAATAATLIEAIQYTDDPSALRALVPPSQSSCPRLPPRTSSLVPQRLLPLWPCQPAPATSLITLAMLIPAAELLPPVVCPRNSLSYS